MTFSGALCSSTDVSGNYSCIVSSGWSGTITPVMGGYAFNPAARSYTNVASDQTGQNYIALLIRGFESGGVSTTQVSGTEGAWVMVGFANYLSGVLPHGGARMAEFNSHNAASGSQTRLYLNNGILVSGDSMLKFWMYHDTGYPSSNDRVQVQVSTDAVAWTDVGSAISRYTGQTGWSQASVDLSAYAGQTVYIGFLGISECGNDIYMDDVTLPEAVMLNLTVTLAGTGGGNVNSVTAGISFSCASGLSCPAKQLPYNTIITLAATPNTTSLFSGWSGACTNTSGNCEITLNADKSVTATFTAMPFLKMPGTSPRYYSAFAAALADTVAMPDNSSVTLYGQATTITGGLILNRPVSISFAGGFDAGFQSNTGGLVTTVTGGVKISKGALRVKNLVVR